MLETRERVQPLTFMKHLTVVHCTLLGSRNGSQIQTKMLSFQMYSLLSVTNAVTE